MNIPCKTCGGSGRHLWSRYGGNDPDVSDIGPCEPCDGSGDQPCDWCDSGRAAVGEVTYEIGRRVTVAMCFPCLKAWREDEAAEKVWEDTKVRNLQMVCRVEQGRA